MDNSQRDRTTERTFLGGSNHTIAIAGSFLHARLVDNRDALATAPDETSSFQLANRSRDTRATHADGLRYAPMRDRNLVGVHPVTGD
jgi:hypothetical protein